MAGIEAITGNIDGANRLLEAAVEAGWTFAYTHIGPVDPLLENLRGHPTFERIMARARAKLDRQREAIEDMVLPPTMQDFEEMIRRAREELLPLLASSAPQLR